MADDAARDYTLFGDEHIAKYEATDGEVGYLWNGAPCSCCTPRVGRPASCASSR